MAENLVMIAWIGIGISILAFILRTVSFNFLFNFKTNFTFALISKAHQDIDNLVILDLWLKDFESLVPVLLVIMGVLGFVHSLRIRWANIEYRNQESQDGNKEFENLGRRWRWRPMEACWCRRINVLNQSQFWYWFKAVSSGVCSDQRYRRVAYRYFFWLCEWNKKSLKWLKPTSDHGRVPCFMVLEGLESLISSLSYLIVKNYSGYVFREAFSHPNRESQMDQPVLVCGSRFGFLKW